MNGKVQMMELGKIACLALWITCGSAYASRQNRVLYSGWKFYKGDVAGAEKVEFDDRDWTFVEIPHDWAIEGPYSKENRVGTDQFTSYVRWTKEGSAGYLPFGIGWYRKTFELPKEADGKYSTGSGKKRSRDHSIGSNLDGGGLA
jgi:beta-galactosidase